jgi:NACHT domain
MRQALLGSLTEVDQRGEKRLLSQHASLQVGGVWTIRFVAGLLFGYRSPLRPQIWQSARMSGGKRPLGWTRLIARRPSRHTGLVALALLFGPIAVAMSLAHHYQLGMAQTAITALVGGGTLPALYVGWVTYRDSRAGRGPLTLAGVADELAGAVRSQWETEAEVRRLNDPYPLPVRWVAADESLADQWDVLMTLATEGAGWPSPPPPGTWATGPDDLAGEGGDLVNVLARVPTGRLLVLGEPGGGKTMLMVRLVLDLLARRKSGDPIPVLCSLASWNPRDNDLYGWLTAQLTIDHPSLAGDASASSTGTRISSLLKEGLILPILDGLDEIPDALRISAISRVNDALRPGQPIVVTCRTEQYRDLIKPPDAPGAALRAAAAVQLCQLDASSVSRYLRDDARGPIAAARWNPVLAALGTQAPVGRALVSPLMVSLARIIYNPRPGENVEALPDPAELCNPALIDQAAVQSRLLDAFVPAAYRSHPNHVRSCRWTAQRAERWLVFLARHLEQTLNSPDLAWWQLQQAVPFAVIQLIVGTVVGLVVGLTFTRAGGISVGLMFGTAAGVVTGAITKGATGPSRGMRFGILRSTSGLWGVFGIGLLSAFIAWLVTGFIVGVVIGAVLVLVSGTVVGLRAVPDDLAVASSPMAVLARDRRAALVPVLLAGLAFALVLGLSSRAADRSADLTAWLVAPVTAWLTVISVSPLVVAVIFSMKETAWPAYMLARACLAMRHQLPWSLTGFLSDAHRRGVLRQAGAVYQFRHLELQQRLASPHPLEQTVPLDRLITALAADSRTGYALSQELGKAATIRSGQDPLRQGLRAWEPVIAATVASSGGDRDAVADLVPLLNVLAQDQNWAALDGVLRRILNGDLDHGLLEGLDVIDTAIAGEVLTRLTRHKHSHPQDDLLSEPGPSLT